MSAIERRIQILRMIPRYPQKIDSASIERKLIVDGYELDKRTIQRDLADLSRLFPLACDQKRPYGWSWMPDVDIFDIPRMDTVAALTFRMAEAFLSQLMPPAALRTLNPHFKHASKVLDAVNCEHLNAWPDKIRILSRSQPLSPLNIDDSVLETVYQSLLEGKCFSAVYRRRGESENTEYPIINPLGIVVLDSATYLICTMKDYNRVENIRQLSMHRLISVNKSEAKSLIPDGFNLQSYIDKGGFNYLQSEGTIKLKVAFDKNVAMHLRESVLSNDQTLTETDSDKVIVEASVLDTSQLRWWLLGFGEKVEVIEPISLREEFRQKAKKMSESYS